MEMARIDHGYALYHALNQLVPVFFAFGDKESNIKNLEKLQGLFHGFQ